MYKFKDLKKLSKTEVEGKEFRLCVLGNVATQFFSTGIKGYLKAENINANVLDTDYNLVLTWFHCLKYLRRKNLVT